MVQQQLKAHGIKDERVLAAMAKVPREEFVPPESRGASYADGPLPIGLVAPSGPSAATGSTILKYSKKSKTPGRG